MAPLSIFRYSTCRLTPARLAASLMLNFILSGSV
jgi:hypothetical protein